MAQVRCDACVGSGKVMGSGMVHKDCDVCNGNGKISDDVKKDFSIDENSKGYKEAIQKIQELHDGISEEKAKEIFEDELKKINLKDEKNDSANSSKKDSKKK